jgi:PE family
MSFVITAPALVDSAATDLAGIGSNVNAANAAAATQTTAVLAAGADEVSQGIATLFGSHAADTLSTGGNGGDGGNRGNAVLIGKGGNGGQSFVVGFGGLGGSRGLVFGANGAPGGP